MNVVLHSLTKEPPISRTRRLLDVVALTVDIPERELVRGQVGAIVDVVAPDVFEVEFSDDEGRTYAEIALGSDRLMTPHSQPA